MARRHGDGCWHVGRGSVCPLVVDRLQHGSRRSVELCHVAYSREHFQLGNPVPVVHGHVVSGHPALLGFDVLESQARCLVNPRKSTSHRSSTTLVEPDRRVGLLRGRRGHRPDPPGVAELPLVKPQREFARGRLR